jgi:hypothetical protein
MTVLFRATGWVLFFVLSTIAAYHSIRSTMNLNPSISGARWKVLLQGPFAEKELFTPTGWRHRNLAMACYLIGIGVGLVMFLIT